METIVFNLPARVIVKEPRIPSNLSSENQQISYNVSTSRLLSSGTILQYEFIKRDSEDHLHSNYDIRPIFDNQQCLTSELISDSNSKANKPDCSDKVIPFSNVETSILSDQSDSDCESFVFLDGETTCVENQELVAKKRTGFVERFKKIGLSSLFKNLASNFHRNQTGPQIKALDCSQSNGATSHDRSDTAQLNELNFSKKTDHDGKPITFKFDPLEIGKGQPETEQFSVKDTIDDIQVNELPDDYETEQNEGQEKDNIIDEDVIAQLIEFVEDLREATIDQLIAFVEMSEDETSFNAIETEDISQAKITSDETIKAQDDKTNGILEDETIKIPNYQVKSQLADETLNSTSIESDSIQTKMADHLEQNLKNTDSNSDSLAIFVNESEVHFYQPRVNKPASSQPTSPIITNSSSYYHDIPPQVQITVIPEKSTLLNEPVSKEPDQNPSTPLSSPEPLSPQASSPDFGPLENIKVGQSSIDKEENQINDQPKPQTSKNVTQSDSSGNLKEKRHEPIITFQLSSNDERRVNSESLSQSSSCDKQIKRRRLTNGFDVSGMKIRAALTLIAVEKGWKQDGDRSNIIFQNIYKDHGENQDKIQEILIEKNCIKIYTKDRHTRLTLIQELKAINSKIKETSPYQLYVQNPLKPSIQFLVHDVIYNLSCSEFISQIRSWNGWDNELTVHVESKEWIRKIRKGKISLIIDSRIRDVLEMEDLIIKVDENLVKVFDKFGISQCSVCLRFGHSKCRSRIRCFFCSGFHPDKVRHDKYAEQRYCFLCNASGHTPIAKNCPTLINEIRSKLELIDYEYTEIFLGNDRSY